MVRFDRIIKIAALTLLAGASLVRAAPTAATNAGEDTIGKHMSLSGPIDARFVAAIEEVSSKYPTIRVLVIDSEGGEVEAALRLAQLVRDHGWDVAVKNKCLSACANFVFPAGKRKIVLPNSWVGIHATRREFHRNDGSIYYVSGNEIAQTMSTGNIDATSVDAARKWDADTASFYHSLGLSTVLLQDFANYVSYRKRVLGVETINDYPDVEGCPRYKAWALNKKQLEGMGITGIVEFWFPANQAEEGTLYKTGEFQPGSIYIGSAEKLGTLCKGPPLNWFERLRLKRG